MRRLNTKRLKQIVSDSVASVESFSGIGKKSFSIEGKFHRGFAPVKDQNNKWNWINKKEELQSPQWFDYIIYDFDNNLLAVQLNDKWNFLDLKGNYLTKWLDSDFFWRVMGLVAPKVKQTMLMENE